MNNKSIEQDQILLDHEQNYIQNKHLNLLDLHIADQLIQLNLYKNFDKKHYPNAENQYSRTISIPLFPDMTKEQSDYVIEVITKIGNENRI